MKNWFVLLTALTSLAISSPARSADCITKINDEIEEYDGRSTCAGFVCCVLAPVNGLTAATLGMTTHWVLDKYYTTDLRKTHALLTEAKKGRGPVFSQFVEDVIRFELNLGPNERISIPRSRIEAHRDHIAETLKAANRHELFCEDHRKTLTYSEIYLDYVNGFIHQSLELERQIVNSAAEKV